jgi:ubiquitin-protein ligase
MDGLLDTAWHGAQFRLRIYFSQQFSNSPPEIYFLTVPFHPNVDPKTGRPCCALLESDGWRSDIRLTELLLYLQVFWLI